MKPCLLLGLLLVAGCANLTISKNDLISQITLSKVEQLAMGKSTKEDLVRLFGKPTTILFPKNSEAWIYDNAETQRASFSINSKGIILSALWIPVSGKECSDKNCLLSHFKNLSFKFEKKTEQLSKHDVVYYLSYSNQETGVSINLPMKSDEVSYVIFDLPLKKCSPAAFVEKKL
jgi:hypothetical protein